MSSIVVGWDGTPGGRDALALADLLAAGLGARLVIAHVYPVTTPASSGFDTRLADVADAGLAAIDLDPLVTASVDTLSIAADTPARGLREVAEAERAALIVVGTTARGRIGRVLVGSVARRLLHGSPCAIAVAPRGLAQHELHTGVVAAAFDLSPESQRAVDQAAAIASALGASVRIIAIEPVSARHFDDLDVDAGFAGAGATPSARLQAGVSRVRAGLPARLRAEGRLLKGDPVETLIEEAGAGVDLLVMGSRGHGALGRVFAGSVSAAVLEAAPCPVIVVPRQAQTPRRAPAVTALEPRSG
jgi:nucleotide-binding universal stress UspA family protein